MKNMDIPVEQDAAAPVPQRSGGSLQLTSKDIGTFLKELKQTDHSDTTIASYRQTLMAYYDFLPSDKRIDGSSLPAWRVHLAENGYSLHSINSKTSAVNSFYNFLGERNWQSVNNEKIVREENGPEISRAEYLAMLCEAKHQGKIQLYLIVKTLACTDLVPSDLHLLTREAVEEGIVSGKMRGTDRNIRLPAFLLEDLKKYVLYCNISSGPVFLNGNGNPYRRTAITRMIQLLGDAIHLEPGKANPRNLHRLYLNTLGVFQKQADAWVSDCYARLLEEEEGTAGWQT